MDPGSVSSFPPSTSRVVTNDGMVSVRIIIIQKNKLWGVRRGGQINSIVFRGNRNGIWKSIRGILGSYFQAGTIINGNNSYIKSQSNAINWNGIIESVINCPDIVLSH